MDHAENGAPARSVAVDDSRVIARLTQMLAESNDKQARYAAMADALADRVQLLEGMLREARAKAEGVRETE